jgi:hypothetical protein
MALMPAQDTSHSSLHPRYFQVDGINGMHGMHGMNEKIE